MSKADGSGSVGGASRGRGAAGGASSGAVAVAHTGSGCGAYGTKYGVYNTSIYVFGGTGPVTGYGADLTGAVCHNDMCVFSLLQPHKPVWRRDPHGHAFPGEPPSARHCHGAAIVDNNMVLVGGSTRGPYCARESFPKLLNDVHCLSLGTKVDGDYVRSKIIIHSNQSKHRHPTRIFELKDITTL